MDSMNLSAELAHEPALASDFVLSGRVLRPLSLSLDQLRAYESVLASPFDLRCFTTNRYIRRVGRYRGVRLTDLIAEAGLRNEAPGDFKRMVFVAGAWDGYAVTFSWHELFNTPVGEHALIAYECDGEPLSAEEGAPILFSGADIMAAPRHVKRLARIDVQVLRPL
ncbi:molybdopterin-dependent oxidoreductase [Paraburkholderia phenazinium]|uniref:Oxidoreductase molybdopterin binding domain-containing protein n=1 Tax=Paraburkholderia phenazinium TaxID=60549 RepID=A0A1G8AUE9_9BURK|nr:molybdopterin-dependent oxidoreductase [Paraburkholderia phenazinium]SDH23970.1 Oxidoreductase molybdopterin binding domain-containing protein [Paraburkholderia phenazinium]